MNERSPVQWTPRLPDEDILKNQSLRYIALNRWVHSHLVEMASAQLPLKTAYAAYRQWCHVTGTAQVPIQAFNGILANWPATEWPTVRRRRTAKGIVYQNLTLRSWAEATPSPCVEGCQPAASGKG